MPEVPLKLIPGVNVEATETLNESGISSCNLIRFKAKLPQKLGGWTRYYPFALSGVPRAVLPWQDLNATGRLGVGTTQQLVVVTEGTLEDITPQQLVSDFAPDFSTTMGSATVEVDDPNILNVTTFDSVFFNTPVSVGGIILSGLYQIVTVTGATTYTITAAEPATATEANAGTVPEFTTTSGSSEIQVLLADHGLSVDDVAVFPLATTVGGVTIEGAYNAIQIDSVDQFSISASNQASATATVTMNGGDAQLVYYISLGPAATGVGYGLGGYGLGGYGTGVVPDAQTGTPIDASGWTLDNWGEILLACPTNGAIYYWRPGGGFQTATAVPGAPVFNGGIFVSMPQQILVAWGSTIQEEIGVRQDPLLVRWSDSENFFDWTATSGNMAGSYRIPTGSKIMGALQAPQSGLLWTDLDVYAMKFIRQPLVFGFTKVGSGCGLIGPHARTMLRGNVYWMGQGNFFVMDGGGVRPVPCTVWDVVFQNLNTGLDPDGVPNTQKCVAAANSNFDEVTFYFPSANGNGENDSYVKLNTVEGTWDYGTLDRSSWSDQSALGPPIGTTPTGIVYQHETSFDADGQPLNWFFETGWFVITEGQDMAFVDWFFPDMKWGAFDGSQNATVLTTIYATDYPNGTVRSYGPYSMSAARTFINCRARGRQIKLRFEGNDLGTFARLGLMRYRFASDGRR